ncbi:MAG: Ig-like domain-containing protein, partial [Treponema sp.]|nr:Ig-like domain-containing protein [Treponema sp.]
MKKLLMGLVAVTLVFVACDNNVNGTGGGEEENVTPPTGPSGIPISGVMITPSTVTMLKLTQDAVTEQLAFTILPPTHTQETTVTWSSSDEEVATVDASGMITAVGGGT